MTLQTCPWWFIGSFDNPLRHFIHSPDQILSGLVHEGQFILDVGCGMGYFTIPLARMVGSSGMVIAADLQEQMLAGVRKRAARAGVLSRIQFQRCAPDHIGVDQQVDFALAFWMVHEIRNQVVFFEEIRQILRPGAHLLIVEPIIHVSEARFQQIIAIARGQGFNLFSGPRVRFSRSFLISHGG